MMKEISINLVVQQDEDESVFLQNAVKAALLAFRKTRDERQHDPPSVCPQREKAIGAAPTK